MNIIAWSEFSLKGPMNHNFYCPRKHLVKSALKVAGFSLTAMLIDIMLQEFSSACLKSTNSEADRESDREKGHR